MINHPKDLPLPKHGLREVFYDCFTRYHTHGEDSSEMVSLVEEYLEEGLSCPQKNFREQNVEGIKKPVRVVKYCRSAPASSMAYRIRCAPL